MRLVIRIVTVAVSIAIGAIDAVAQTVSVGVGGLAVGGESREHAPLVASARVAIVPRVVVETEWQSRTRFYEFFDSGRVGLATLNGQLGEYGHTTRSWEIDRQSIAVNFLVRSRGSRVAGFGGVGVTAVRSTDRHTGTWTGCTGPWIAHCSSGNYDRSYSRTHVAPQWLGGLDVDVSRRLQVYAGGRLTASTNAAVFEAGVTGGLRLVLLPGRQDGPRVWATLLDGTERTGTLVSALPDSITLRTAVEDLVVVPTASIRLMEKPDSTLDGAMWGLLFGALAGWGLSDGQKMSVRSVPGLTLAGVGIGIVIDELIVGRKVVK